MSGDYSLDRARRSLAHFAVGKVASALAGIAVLLLILRWVLPLVYGTYVALMAIVEIFYLVSGLGLGYYVQRYLPELRVKGAVRQFNRTLVQLALGRMALALAFALPLWLGASYWVRWIDLSLSPLAVDLFLLCLVAGAAIRFLDEVMQALLLQGFAQMQTLLGNLTRLAALVWAGATGRTIDLAWLLWLELGVSSSVTLIGCGLLGNYVLRRGAASAETSMAEHQMPGAARQSLRFYLAHLLSQTYGMNAVKLMVTGIVGVQGTALLGYAHSVTNLLRTYSPAFLLAGWVRPLLVSRFVARPTAASLRPVTRLMVGVSVLGLLPFVPILLAFGTELTAWVGKGRYAEGAVLLAPLVVVICLQAAHAILGMVCATLERASFVLIATVICQLSVPVAVLLTLQFGVAGTVAALFLAELLWLTTVLRLLARQVGEMELIDWRGLGRSLLAAALLSVLLLLWETLPVDVASRLWLPAAFLALAVFWLLAWMLKAIGLPEQALIRSFLKSRQADSRAVPSSSR